MVLVNYPASKLSMRVSPTPQPPRTPRERLLGGYCQTSYIVFHEKKKTKKRRSWKNSKEKTKRVPDSTDFKIHAVLDLIFNNCKHSTNKRLLFIVFNFIELTMRCFVYFRSKEAVEEKLSSTLYPFASQRTASGAMSSNLGTWHKVVVTLGHTICRDFVILRLHLPHILHTDNTK